MIRLLFSDWFEVLTFHRFNTDRIGWKLKPRSELVHCDDVNWFTVSGDHIS